MKTTQATDGRLTLYAWDKVQFEDSLRNYKMNGYELDYLKDELYRTKTGPMRTWTAVLSPTVRYNFGNVGAN